MATKPVSNAKTFSGAGASPAPALPSAADLDNVAEEQTAADATSTAIVPADPKQAELAKANDVVNSHLAKETDAIDSVGKPKDGGKPVLLGPRGTNAPRDAKPAPSDKEKRSAQPKSTATDKVDNAGAPKNVEHHIGIRGLHNVRDTYKL